MSTNLVQIRQSLIQEGCTGPHSLLDPKSLIPFQEMIYDHMRPWLIPNNDINMENQSLVQKLRAPVDPGTPQAVGLELRKKMIPVVEEFASTNREIRAVFEEILGTKNCLPCSAFHDFRGNMPVKGQPLTGWHQDNETFFTMGKKEWRHPNFTMWTSLNGADEKNSMELIPHSHTAGYLYAQHYANTLRTLEEIAPRIASLPKVSFHIEAGESYFLGPMTFHRSIPNQHNYARFSIDIRFYDPNTRVDLQYKIAPWLYLKRAELITRQSKLYQAVASNQTLRRMIGRQLRITT